jgi:hypothetical protein
VSLRRIIMAKKKPVLTILQRMDDEAFKYPIAYSIPGQAVGYSRWLSKADDDISVWGRLKQEAGE